MRHERLLLVVVGYVFLHLLHVFGVLQGAVCCHPATLLAHVAHLPTQEQLVFGFVHLVALFCLAFPEPNLVVVLHLLQGYILGLLQVDDGLEFLLLALQILDLIVVFLGHDGVLQSLLQVPYFGLKYLLLLGKVVL